MLRSFPARKHQFDSYHNNFCCCQCINFFFNTASQVIEIIPSLCFIKLTPWGNANCRQNTPVKLLPQNPARYSFPYRLMASSPSCLFVSPPLTGCSIPWLFPKHRALVFLKVLLLHRIRLWANLNAVTKRGEGELVEIISHTEQ